MIDHQTQSDTILTAETDLHTRAMKLISLIRQNRLAVARLTRKITESERATADLRAIHESVVIDEAGGINEVAKTAADRERCYAIHLAAQSDYQQCLTSIEESICEKTTLLADVAAWEDELKLIRQLIGSTAPTVVVNSGGRYG